MYTQNEQGNYYENKTEGKKLVIEIQLFAMSEEKYVKYSHY